ncbi:ABC transporter family substrate-binding protein [Skermania piniformis]|uniref:ABC transporter family substrate-binding protein n=1 Tax=Skermania pinensis TaxID=39122 RepID=A0ABX8S7L2_9ACTN|nr:ABC transporter family substrate-binding protein [Skermania piniformis]QXQ13167.1 ABC transporter family substrate-binding protein [Skermania piniformis]
MRVPVGRAVVAAALAVALSGCTADPPPPIESTDSPRTTTPTPTQSTVVVAIDDVGTGFNPHLLADLSPTNAAVSSLVLPSPFRPVPDPATPGVVNRVPDTGVLVSADVTAQQPFTITYRIRDEAQWSDGAPIAAEDFRYLWRQMITEPGVVDPAGYELISDVDSSGGGKTVKVTMAAPYPAWRELFSDLLPAHLVKDTPGGFRSGLAETIPVSGSHFRIRSVDRGRDEILLERNDRYWDAPAKPDQILLRRGGSADQLADSIRSGDTQIAVLHGGSVVQAQLGIIPNVQVNSTYQPRALRLTVNGRFAPFTDERVRRAVLALLDPRLLAAVGAQDTFQPEPAAAQVLSPSDPGYLPTEPPRPDTAAAAALLGEVGYSRTLEPSPSTGSPRSVPMPFVRDATALAFRIGVAEGDDTAIAVANTAADQLRGAGVTAGVRVLEPEELYGPALLTGTVDAVVGWADAGGDPATVLASRYGCPAAPTQSAQPAGGPESDRPEQLGPSNLSGVCDPALQPTIDAGLHGIGDVAGTIATLEPRLWDRSVVRPILQDQTLVVVGPGVSGVGIGGPLPMGIFAGAERWARQP